MWAGAKVRKVTPAKENPLSAINVWILNYGRSLEDKGYNEPGHAELARLKRRIEIEFVIGTHGRLTYNKPDGRSSAEVQKISTVEKPYSSVLTYVHGDINITTAGLCTYRKGWDGFLLEIMEDEDKEDCGFLLQQWQQYEVEEIRVTGKLRTGKSSTAKIGKRNSSSTWHITKRRSEAMAWKQQVYHWSFVRMSNKCITLPWILFVLERNSVLTMDVYIFHWWVNRIISIGIQIKWNLY